MAHCLIVIEKDVLNGTCAADNFVIAFPYVYHYDDVPEGGQCGKKREKPQRRDRCW